MVNQALPPKEISATAAPAALLHAALQQSDALSAGIAHELNNLLTAIGFQLELLQEAAGGVDAHVSALERLAGRAAEMAASLQALARGPGDAPQPAGAAVNRALLYLRLVWSGKHIHLTMPASLPEVAVPGVLAELSLRLLMVYLARAVPRGWQGTLRGGLAGGRLLVTVTPDPAPDPAPIPALPARPQAGALPADGDLQALQSLLAAAGGDLAVSGGAEGCTVALWLPLAGAECGSGEEVADL